MSGNHVRIILALVAVTSVGVLRAQASDTASAEPVKSDCFPPELLNFAFGGGYPTGFAENFRSGITYEEGGRLVTRTTSERASAESPWFRATTSHAVSFRITAVGFRDAGEVLYVAGIRDGDCADVIEEWTFTPAGGARVLRAAVSPTTTPSIGPIGTPAPPLVMTPGVADGGGFVLPAARKPPLPERRRVVYEGTSLGHIRDLVADPEGRFLLLQAHGDSGIYRMDLRTPPPFVPRLLHSQTSTPSLSRTTCMNVYDIAAAGGRVCMLSSPDGCVMPIDADWVLLKDTDNDGSFELQAFSNRAWQASPYADRTTWELPACAPGCQPYAGK